MAEISAHELRISLQNEFSRRCRSNQNYSLRAFARQIGIEASTISQILSGKRNVSPRMIAKISAKIAIAPGATRKGTEFNLMREDAFAAISDWYHIAILELTHVPGFKNHAEWIARRLGISAQEANAAVERLVRLGLLVQVGRTLVKAERNTVNYLEGQTSTAHKEYQRQIIAKAAAAIDGCPQERKDITAISIAADSARLATAKQMIRKFRRELCEFLEGGTADSVYMLSVQLFPASEPKE